MPSSLRFAREFFPVRIRTEQGEPKVKTSATLVFFPVEAFKGARVPLFALVGLLLGHMSHMQRHLPKSITP